MRRGARRSGTAFTLAWATAAVCGCGKAGSALTSLDGGAPGHFASSPLKATVRENPENVVSALVDVESHRGDMVAIDYGDSVDYLHRTADFLVDEGGAVTIPVLGLTPGSRSHLRVTAWHADGSSRSTDDLTFDAGPLPPDLPSFVVSSGSRPLAGYLLIGLIQIPRSTALAAMVDGQGNLQWYRRAAPSDCGLDFQRQPNGRLTLYQWKSGAFEELDLAGNLVHVWNVPMAASADGHEMLLGADDHALLFGRAPETVDTRPWVDGGVPDALAWNATVDEVDRDGGTVMHWDALERIGLGETDSDVPFDPAGFEPLRPDALSVAAGGDLLVSFENTSSIMKVARGAGAILWRFGGRRSDFKLQGDPAGGFSHQHDARPLPNGDLLVFDNGVQHVPRESRVVEYRLDERSRTATMMWEYHHVPPLYTDEAGSARRMPGGNTIVSWGRLGVVTEIDPFAAVQWEMTVPGATLYRAVPVPSLYF